MNMKRRAALRTIDQAADEAEPTLVKPQSVLVVGAGAVGCVYGGRLLEAGHEVSFLMRRDLQAVKAKVR